VANLTLEQFEAELEAGPYAWPGGYPRYFIARDGEALSFKAVEANAHLIREALRDGDDVSGWFVIAVDVNWEDPDLYCAHTNERIESAYAEEEPEEEDNGVHGIYGTEIH
jgi:hypothetical protein